MRVRPFVLFAAALVAGLSARAGAQVVTNLPTNPTGDGSANFVLAAGPAFPVGDLRNGANNGFAALLGVGLTVPIVPVGFRLEGQYQTFGFKEGGGHVNTLTGGINAILRSASPSGIGFLAHPFLTGGVGYGRTSVGLGDATSPSIGRGNGVTWNVGGGIAIPVPFVNVGVEARYTEVRVDGNSLGSVPVFVTLTFTR